MRDQRHWNPERRVKRGELVGTGPGTMSAYARASQDAPGATAALAQDSLSGGCRLLGGTRDLVRETLIVECQ